MKEANSQKRRARGSTQKSQGINERMTFLEHKDGTTFSSDMSGAVRAKARSIWTSHSYDTGPIAFTFTQMADDRLQDYFQKMYNAYPELSYCEDDWKVREVGISEYSKWHQKRYTAQPQPLKQENLDDDEGDENEDDEDDEDDDEEDKPSSSKRAHLDHRPSLELERRYAKDRRGARMHLRAKLAYAMPPVVSAAVLQSSAPARMAISPDESPMEVVEPEEVPTTIEAVHDTAISDVPVPEDKGKGRAVEHKQAPPLKLSNPLFDSPCISQMADIQRKVPSDTGVMSATSSTSSPTSSTQAPASLAPAPAPSTSVLDSGPASATSVPASDPTLAISARRASDSDSFSALSGPPAPAGSADAMTGQIQAPQEGPEDKARVKTKKPAMLRPTNSLTARNLFAQAYIKVHGQVETATFAKVWGDLSAADKKKYETQSMDEKVKQAEQKKTGATGL
ncbi:hypothetical protein FA95DRAFT_1624000 [Auriscalpium vulgare]|uniref:Uncharacterized protein n=1 Tax=Auriscalpium vulgare TaxID=40419 RepID=A0ACB8S6D0_9AGAM|nr:hypothetical protein FA95DRAFT_1624000 [Auriscalpium vulgare]